MICSKKQQNLTKMNFTKRDPEIHAEGETTVSTKTKPDENQGKRTAEPKCIS